MSRRTMLIITGLLAGLLVGCNSTISGSGRGARRLVQIDPFTAVSLDGPGELNLVQGEAYGLLIEMDDNLAGLIRVDEHNGVLALGLEPNLSIQPVAPLIFTVSAPRLNLISLESSGSVRMEGWTLDQLSVVLNGSGDVLIGDLSAQNLTVTINGAGQVHASGQVSTQTIKLTGPGRYDGSGLQSDSAQIEIAASGRVLVWALSQVDVLINGSGNVEVFGPALIRQRGNGSGQVIERGNP